MKKNASLPDKTKPPQGERRLTYYLGQCHVSVPDHQEYWQSAGKSGFAGWVILAKIQCIVRRPESGVQRFRGQKGSGDRD
jgi:hypothetical protein